jgi:hypothetical protein
LLDEFDSSAIDPERCFPDDATMHRRILTPFSPIGATGQAAEGCRSDDSLKLRAFVWPAARLWAILRAAGLPMDFGALTPPNHISEALFAFLKATLIRRRFTVGDLPHFGGRDTENLWERVSPEMRVEV